MSRIARLPTRSAQLLSLLAPIQRGQNPHFSNVAQGAKPKNSKVIQCGGAAEPLPLNFQLQSRGIQKPALKFLAPSLAVIALIAGAWVIDDPVFYILACIGGCSIGLQAALSWGRREQQDDKVSEQIESSPRVEYGPRGGRFTRGKNGDRRYF